MGSPLQLSAIFRKTPFAVLADCFNTVPVPEPNTSCPGVAAPLRLPHHGWGWMVSFPGAAEPTVAHSSQRRGARFISVIFAGGEPCFPGRWADFFYNHDDCLCSACEKAARMVVRSGGVLLAWESAKSPAAFFGLGAHRIGAIDIPGGATRLAQCLAYRKHAFRNRRDGGLATDSNCQV